MESLIQTSVQCSATTKASGIRCKRMTSNDNGLCFQHSKSANPVAKPVPKPAPKPLPPKPQKTKSLSGKPESSKEEVKLHDCCVCLETNVNEDELLECKHSVCKSCVGQLRDPRCPMCRREIKAKWITGASKKRMTQLQKKDKEERNNQLLRAHLQSESSDTSTTVTTAVTQSVFQLMGTQPISTSTRSRSFAPVMFRLPDSEGGITMTFYVPI